MWLEVVLEETGEQRWRGMVGCVQMFNSDMSRYALPRDFPDKHFAVVYFPEKGIMETESLPEAEGLYMVVHKRRGHIYFVSTRRKPERTQIPNGPNKGLFVEGPTKRTSFLFLMDHPDSWEGHGVGR